MACLPTPTGKFQARKKELLAQLALPTAEYTDASPKGSVDEGIRHLIAEINAHQGLVTTSSCAGRVSIFVEGQKKNAAAPYSSDDGPAVAAGSKFASVGGKGGGGVWLFVSHDPIDLPTRAANEGPGWAAFLGLDAVEEQVPDRREGLASQDSSKLIHFKFEPMILHLLTASASHAQIVIRCALEAGFRESGAINVAEGRTTDSEGVTPMVAVRSMGLSFESLIGIESKGTKERIVSEAYLGRLVSIANERFAENQSRIERFRAALTRELARKEADISFESKQERLERKRAEGLRRQGDARRQKEQQQIDQSKNPELDPDKVGFESTLL